MMRAALAVAMMLGLGAATLADSDNAQREQGRRLYHEGAQSAGLGAQATVAGDAVLTGTQAACVTCHRRSGLGSVEGGRVVPPVTAAALFRPRQPTLPGTAAAATLAGRPAYNEEALRRAIRAGVDPAGRALSPLMPRYALDNAGLDAVIAYLKSLSAAPAPGVTAEQIHFATIVTDGVPAAQRAALTAMLEQFFADHNAEIRQQTRRGERAVLGHSRVYRAWRRWQLHVWTLTGAPATWPGQLKRHYRAQPVFAVVSGAGRGAWQPVDEFCERQALPCLFPNTAIPPAGGGFYSLYFSRGLALDAELVAHDLQAPGAAGGHRVLQLYRDDDDGRAAAAALRAALHGAPVTVSDRSLAAGTAAPAAVRRALAESGPTHLVLWLSAEDLAAIAAAGSVPESVPTLYLSSSLLTDPESDVPVAWRSRARLVHAYDLPELWQARRARLTRWLRSHGLEIVDERLQANVYFAASLVGHTLEHLRENYSREYLVERLEHAIENVPWTSVYRTLSLGSGQRYAAKGGYVIRWRAGDGTADAGPWIVPYRVADRTPSG